MKEICQRFVLPLAGPPGGDDFSHRQADQPQVQVLSEALNLRVQIQSVSKDLTTTVIAGSETDDMLGFELLFDGSHYELLYKQ